jgi:CheY-like chemotaxis protein
MSLQVAGVAPGGPHVPATIRALVIDDNAFDRRRVRRLGDRTGLPIEFAEVASVAGLAQALDRGAFDLVLIDYQMPEGDGLQALDFLRAHPLNRDAAAVMLSGRADTAVAVSAMKRGCFDFVAKDEFSADRLRSLLMSVMDPDRPMRTLPRAIPGGDDLTSLLRAALTPDLLRQALSEPVQDEMRRAVQALGIASRTQASPEFVRFLAQFTTEDEFCFRFH